jgi:hypothetical protein
MTAKLDSADSPVYRPNYSNRSFVQMTAGLTAPSFRIDSANHIRKLSGLRKRLRMRRMARRLMLRNDNTI